MNLEPFGWSIGISDIMDWRECPARMTEGMRRHLTLPDGRRDEPPEHRNWQNAYGSAIHDAIHIVETEAVSHAVAIQRVMQRWAQYLTPDDAALLREDLDTYEERRPVGVTLVCAEADLKVPLFIYSGPKVTEPTQVWFRFKVDVLHRLIADPTVYLSRDYKSSKWPKTPQEIHKDVQQWAYNWALHEYFPEMRHLIQTYDMLKFGATQTTKNDAQRAQMKQWLIDVVTAIIEDDVPEPKLNDFCRFCSQVVTCPEPRRATRYWRGQLALMAPMTREGRKVKIEFAEEGDELEDIIENRLPEMMQTRKHIEHVEKEIKGLIQRMTLEDRERLRWRLQDRTERTISSDGLRELHELLGDTFYQLISLPITRLEELFGKPKKGEPVPPVLQLARKWTTSRTSGTNVVRRE